MFSITALLISAPENVSLASHSEAGSRSSTHDGSHASRLHLTFGILTCSRHTFSMYSRKCLRQKMHFYDGDV